MRHTIVYEHNGKTYRTGLNVESFKHSSIRLCGEDCEISLKKNNFKFLSGCERG